MSDKQGPSDKRCAAKRTSDNGEGSATPSTQSPQKPCKPRRKRRHRASSSSSDGIVLEAKRDLRHMERLLLHSGKLHVFRTYFGDPTLDFYVRPDGRRRHAAGAMNRRPPDEDVARAVLGMVQEGADDPVDNHPLDRPLAVQVDDPEPPSVVSSRGLSPGSSFATFPPSPPDYNAEYEVVPFEGLPAIPEEASAAARPRPQPKPASGSSAAEHDEYMASVSASDSDEPARPNVDAFRVADRLNRLMVVSRDDPAPLPPPELMPDNPERLPSPEPMSLSSDPATPRESN